MSEWTYYREIRMRIKEKFNESLSENVIAILIWEMLEKGEPITYESLVAKTIPLFEMHKMINK